MAEKFESDENLTEQDTDHDKLSWYFNWYSSAVERSCMAVALSALL